MEHRSQPLGSGSRTPILAGASLCKIRDSTAPRETPLLSPPSFPPLPPHVTLPSRPVPSLVGLGAGLPLPAAPYPSWRRPARRRSGGGPSGGASSPTPPASSSITPGEGGRVLPVPVGSSRSLPCPPRGASLRSTGLGALSAACAPQVSLLAGSSPRFKNCSYFSLRAERSGQPWKWGCEGVGVPGDG